MSREPGERPKKSVETDRNKLYLEEIFNLIPAELNAQNKRLGHEIKNFYSAGQKRNKHGEVHPFLVLRKESTQRHPSQQPNHIAHGACQRQESGKQHYSGKALIIRQQKRSLRRNAKETMA
ncbi:hypothetical protein B7992_13735 [Fibrobacter sp. UWH1]|nr:hypothetical protein B7992_13735 [Fibrobacter sp. UWH1]